MCIQKQADKAAREADAAAKKEERKQQEKNQNEATKKQGKTDRADKAWYDSKLEKIRKATYDEPNHGADLEWGVCAGACFMSWHMWEQFGMDTMWNQQTQKRGKKSWYLWTECESCDKSWCPACPKDLVEMHERMCCRG